MRACAATATVVLIDRRDPDLILSALAARRHQLLVSDQLQAVGLTRHGIRHRVAKGVLHPQHPGVWSWGRADVPFPGPILAAVWSCRPDAYAGGLATLSLHGLRSEMPGEPVDVVVVGRQVRGPAGVRVHRCRIDPRDLGCHGHVPTTTVARALLDAATRMDPTALELAMVDADVARLASRGALETMLRRYPSHPGARRFNAVLALDDAEGLTRSWAEQRTRTLLRRARLNGWTVNRKTSGHRVDFTWPRAMVVLEINGFATHGRRRGFEADHRRQLDLERDGWHVLRASARQVRDEAEAVIASVAAVLARATAPGR